MTVRFKFAEPVNRSVVEIDPTQGAIETTNTDATIDYKINMDSTVPDAILNIDELISFLETVRDRLRKIN